MKVTLVMAITLDGKIGRDADHFPDWTGKADKKLFVDLTKKAGVLIMGSKTFDTIGKPLPGRKNVIMTRDKTRQSNEENLVFTDKSPSEILNDLEEEGFKTVILAGGAQINTLFARAGCIDELVVTVCPKIFGAGISLFAGNIDMNLELRSMESLTDQVICLRYRVLA